MPKEPFLLLDSCNLHGTKLRGERKELGPVVSLAMFEHAEDGVQELPHDGHAHIFDAPHLIVFPALAVMLAVLAFNFLGDALRDYLDPRLNKEFL